MAAPCSACSLSLFGSSLGREPKYGALLPKLAWQKHKAFQGRAEVLLHNLQNDGVEDKNGTHALFPTRQVQHYVDSAAQLTVKDVEILLTLKLDQELGWKARAPARPS